MTTEEKADFAISIGLVAREDREYFIKVLKKQAIDALEQAAELARDQKAFVWAGGEEWAAGYVDGKDAAAQAIEALVREYKD